MGVFEEQFVLRFSECDRHGRMKLKTLFDYAQEAGGVHASALGVGSLALHQKHQAWFLSRMRVRFSAYPVIGEKVTVKTWPSGFDRLFSLRDFRFSTADKGEFAVATSDWLLMDTDAMRILPVAKLLADVLPENLDEPPAFPGLGKLAVAPESAPCVLRKIMATQIDINGHLNNTEYAGIMQDALGMGVYPQEFQLNYQKGVPPEALLRVDGSRDGKDFIFAGRVEGVVVFEAAGSILHIEEGDTVYGI